jgi:hypothetical protein
MPTNFENLAHNPLDGVMVAYSRRSDYADINIERMTKINPGGVYDSIIALTKTKRDAFNGNLSESQMGEALRMGYTSEINQTKDEFVADVSKFEGLVKSLYDKGSAVYIMFFPFGIEEYRRATQAELVPLMKRIIDLCIIHKTNLGSSTFEDKFVALRDRYVKATSDQKQAAATITSSQPTKEILWNILKKQLHINMLTILINNPDNLGIMLSYFEQKLLRFRHLNKDGNAEEAYKLMIAALSSKVADISFSVNDTLLIMNNSNIPIYYYAAATADTAQPAQLHEIAIGDEAEVTAAQLGAPANKHLIFVNKDATEGAEVEIALI